MYNCVYISWNEVFSKILNKQFLVHMNAKLIFIGKKQKIQKNVIFQLQQYSIYHLVTIFTIYDWRHWQQGGLTDIIVRLLNKRPFYC
jgi:hypothetical protein